MRHRSSPEAGALLARYRRQANPVANDSRNPQREHRYVAIGSFLRPFVLIPVHMLRLGGPSTHCATWLVPCAMSKT